MNPSQANEQGVIEQAAQKLTIEQEEEKKLRIKYPNPQKPGGSAFIQKMLHKGSKKYFDSGDYNMAKSKKQTLTHGKAPVEPPIASSGASDSSVSTPVTQVRVEGGSAVPQVTVPVEQPMLVNEMSSPIINVSCESNSMTPDTSSVHNVSSTHSEMSKPSTPMQKNNILPSEHSFLSGSNLSSPLSSSLSSNNLQGNATYLGQHLQASQSSQSISMLSSSISSDKLSQIQINQHNPCLLDSEEIGHGIPTPECLPQSRKHSIVQSKLATPRLSSS